MKNTGKILVVDDDPEVLALLREQLKGTEFKARFAASSTEALKKAATLGEMELLLTDVLLPDGNGIELARTLSARHPRLKVAYMSGYFKPALHDPDDPSAPAKAFIQKPFSGKTMLGFLRKTRDGGE